jgi:hypothetical protein
MRKSLVLGSLLATLIVIVIGSYVIVAQTAITGDWKAETKNDEPDKINLSFERRAEKGGHYQNGSTFEYSDLQGLTREQAQNGNVSFRLAREAGTIECQGTFTNGKGFGTFQFTPNRAFLDSMKSRGFDFEKSSSKHQSLPEDRLFTATTLNLTTAFVDDLLSANFGPLDVDDLFKARIFNITPQFMAEMKATGFPNLGMEDLVKARIFKIDANYVRQVRDMGFDKEDFEGLIKFRIFKVTPEFLNEIKSEGFANLTPEEIVKFRIFKIDADFIRQARAEEPNITVEGLVRRRIGIRNN